LLCEIGIISDTSILDVGNSGYESDFMSRVHLEYDCCEELNVKFHISTVSLNTSFKHTVSHLDDFKIANRISNVENMIIEKEWKRLHTSSHNKYSALIYICLILTGLYTGCNRRNGPDFGRVFLRSNYTNITQNTYIQS